jgi:hypothetical protein
MAGCGNRGGATPCVRSSSWAARRWPIVARQVQAWPRQNVDCECHKQARHVDSAVNVLAARDLSQLALVAHVIVAVQFFAVDRIAAEVRPPDTEGNEIQNVDAHERGNDSASARRISCGRKKRFDFRTGTHAAILPRPIPKEIGSFFRKSSRVVIPLTIREILDEEAVLTQRRRTFAGASAMTRARQGVALASEPHHPT